jgi:hypothetical protein
MHGQKHHATREKLAHVLNTLSNMLSSSVVCILPTRLALLKQQRSREHKQGTPTTMQPRSTPTRMQRTLAQQRWRQAGHPTPLVSVLGAWMGCIQLTERGKLHRLCVLPAPSWFKSEVHVMHASRRQEGYLLAGPVLGGLPAALNAQPLGSARTACVLQPHPKDSVVMPHISTARGGRCEARCHNMPCICFAFVLLLLSHSSGGAVPEHPVGSQCGSHGGHRMHGSLMRVFLLPCHSAHCRPNGRQLCE